MDDVSDERPQIRCLVALPGLLNQRWPRAYCVCDLRDVERWIEKGWLFVAIDPADEKLWLEWLSGHLDAA